MTTLPLYMRSRTKIEPSFQTHRRSSTFLRQDSSIKNVSISIQDPLCKASISIPDPLWKVKRSSQEYLPTIKNSPTVPRHSEILGKAMLGEVANGVVVGVGMEVRYVISDGHQLQLIHETTTMSLNLLTSTPVVIHTQHPPYSLFYLLNCEIF